MDKTVLDSLGAPARHTLVIGGGESVHGKFMMRPQPMITGVENGFVLHKGYPKAFEGTPTHIVVLYVFNCA